jgi:hypothetical protein
MTETELRQKSNFRNAINAESTVQPGCEKYFASSVGQINPTASPVSPERGTLAIVTNVGRDAVDVVVPEDERRESGRRSRVVLTPRRWRQVGEDAFAIHAGDGDNKARSPAIECTHLLLRLPAKTDSLLGS